MALALTSENFEQEVKNSDVPVLVDFWAPWCGPCRAIGPIVEELSEELAGQAKVTKINTDEQQQLAVEFGIRSIPTLMIFNKGEVVEQFIGVQAKNTLKDKLLYYANASA